MTKEQMKTLQAEVDKDLLRALQREPRVPKHYHFNNTRKLWEVTMRIDKKIKNFGSYKTEDEAKKRVDEIIELREKIRNEKIDKIVDAL